MDFANHIGKSLLVIGLVAASVKLSDAAQAHGSNGQHGGRAAAHISGKAAINTNAQWSADPERGWVRAKEREIISKQRKATAQSGQGKAKQNNAAKKF